MKTNNGIFDEIVLGPPKPCMLHIGAILEDETTQSAFTPEELERIRKLFKESIEDIKLEGVIPIIQGQVSVESVEIKKTVKGE